MYYTNRQIHALVLILTILVGIGGIPLLFSSDALPFVIIKDNDTIRSQNKIELNTCDSIDLIRIPGIGPYFSHRILSYRRQLGGYCSTSQLKEIKHPHFHPDTFLTSFYADTNFIHKKSLDSLSFKELLRHPYLEYEDVRILFQAKRKIGTLSMTKLRKYKVLSEKQLNQLEPYFY